MHIDQFPDERKLMRSSCVYFIKKLETRIKESQNNEVGDEEMVKKEMHECFISNTWNLPNLELKESIRIPNVKKYFNNNPFEVSAPERVSYKNLTFADLF